MIPHLTQEEITQYASNAQVIQKPEGTDYSQGAHVNRTIPAKWWNWLFSAVTKRVAQSRADAANILTELNNVILDADMQPSGSASNQLAQAVAIQAQRQIDEYIAAEKTQAFQTWQRPDYIYFGAEKLTYDIEINNLHEVNGLYIAYIQGCEKSGYVIDYGCASSFDLVHWYRIYTFGAKSQLGCVYEHGEWWVVSGDGVQGGRGIYHSANGIDWSDVEFIDIFPDPPSDLIYHGEKRYAVKMTYGSMCVLPWGTHRVCIVMNYYLDAIASIPGWEPSTEAGVAIVYQDENGGWIFKKVEVTGTSGFGDSVACEGQWCVQELREYRINSASWYALGATLINPSSGLITYYADKAIVLTEEEKTEAGSNRDAKNDVFNAKLIRIRNSRLYYALTSNNIVVYDFSNYTVTTLDWTPDLNSYVVNNDLDVLLLCSDCRNTRFKTAFSYDGVNQVAFPAQWDFGNGLENGSVLSVCRLSGQYYLAVCSTANQSVRGLYKTALLTGDVADYIYLGSMPAYDISEQATSYNRLVPAGYKNWLVAGSYFTRDEGRNWIQGALNISVPGSNKRCSPVIITGPNKLYGADMISSEYTKFNIMVGFSTDMYTKLNVNYVVGHTLYLR